jgi:hypothetical protein
MISIKRRRIAKCFFCLGEQHMQATITWFVVVLGCALPCDDYRLAMANNTGAHGIKRTRRALPCECDEPMTTDCGAAKIQGQIGIRHQAQGIIALL